MEKGNSEEGKEEEEEEEDVDFNPFLIAETPSEASSSLSSEDEVLGDNPDQQIENFSDCRRIASPTRSNEALDHCRKDPQKEYGEVVTDNHPQSEGHKGKVDVLDRLKKKRGLTLDNQQPERNVKQDVTNDESNAAVDTENESPLEPVSNCLPNSVNAFEKPSSELDCEDAICRRTRARHSLANYTLEELETFLQESDDDDNIQNVDDEEEYRKFLSAVLLGGDGNEKAGQEGMDLDEDEENDVDFEIEIEEALESDIDEGVECNKHLKRNPDVDRRPETRQKGSLRNQKKPLGPSNVPLRPLLPSVSNAQPVPFPLLGPHLPYSRELRHMSSSLSALPSNIDTVHGFTAQQIGQLYCLINEHVQLLIQVFSLCILDPSRQHIANDVRKMIFEMTSKHEEALAWKRVPYPLFCFENLHVHQLERYDCRQISEGSSSVPLVRNPVLSVLDVATLCLAKEYMTDVSAAVLKYRDSQVEAVLDKSHMRKEPLFSLPSSMSVGETSSEVTDCPPLSPSQKPKKSLAAVLVENTKKQSVAHVPKGIADLAQRFVPLFNSTLFPRKPPLPALANRVLFTDSEDKLLAMGLMEYNNDWVAIKQRFLPCKSKHQIFIRQKNRSSSKAPENPIKAVRRMKTSPLTANELALISKGLKIFKNDWMTVWKFFVPYRDPSLLPRQWRIATGTQKSYKKSEICKEQRRSYEAKRRKLKASMASLETASEKEVDGGGQDSTDNNMDEEDETYVHEAFLAESEPGSSRPLTSQNAALPYQIHKTAAAKVVKLAPGLPPVNLPPSVRVISQSAFKSYQSVSSYSNIIEGSVKNLVQKSPHVVQARNTPATSRRPEDMFSDNYIKADHVQDPSSRIDHSRTEENYLGSDLQMHPLLFRATENGYQPFYQDNSGAIDSSALNFLSGYPLQNHLNFLKTQQSERAIDFPRPTGNFKESSLSLHTIDFHPLLQRTDDVNRDSLVGFQDKYASGALEPLATDSSLPFYPSIGMSREREVGNGQTVHSSASSSQYEKENELDLDIHLYSTTNKGKKGGSPVPSYRNVDSSSISMSKDRRVIRSLPANSPSSDFVENRHEDVVANPSSFCTVKSIVQSGQNSRACNGGCRIDAPDVPSPLGDACKYTTGDVGDELFPGIVMEQEELSDSDEEIEHVEFECEEMDDSDEDQFDDEHLSEQDVPAVPCNAHGILGRKDPDQQDISRSQASESNENCGTCVIQMQRCTDPNKKGTGDRGSQSIVHSHCNRSKTQNPKGSKASSLKKPEVCLSTTGECDTTASRKHKR